MVNLGAERLHAHRRSGGLHPRSSPSVKLFIHVLVLQYDVPGLCPKPATEDTLITPP